MGHVLELIVGGVIAGAGYGIRQYLVPLVEEFLSGGTAPLPYATILDLGGLFFIGIGGLIAVYAVLAGLYQGWRSRGNTEQQQPRVQQPQPAGSAGRQSPVEQPPRYPDEERY